MGLVCSFSKLLKFVYVLSRYTECLCNSGCDCFWINETNVLEMRMLCLQSVSGAVETIFSSILMLVFIMG